MYKVGQVYYSGVLKVTDESGVAVTTLVNADFTKSVYKNGVAVETPIATVSHLGNGNYQAQITPDAAGTWTLIFTQATYSPDGWSETFAAYAIDAELEYSGGLCTLSEIHDELEIADSDTTMDDMFTRLISSVTSQIINYTQTQFVSKSVSNEYHDIDSYQERVFLNYYPIDSVSEVVEDGTTLTYSSDPDLTEYHIYDGYIEKADGYFTEGKKQLKVTYVANKAVPYEIKQCAIEMVAVLSGKKVRTYTDGQGITNAVTMTSIPQNVRDILDRYKRVVF